MGFERVWTVKFWGSVGSTEVRSTSKRSGEEKEKRGERLGEAGGDGGWEPE